MKLYAVTKRRTAVALRAGQPLNYADSLVLDVIDGGVVQSPSLVWYHFSWLADLRNENFSGDLSDWEEIIVDVPEELAKPFECPCMEGGNSLWYLPRRLVDQFLIRADPGERP